MVPRVFISHASDDKERFVVDFAARLREKGIDAWLDKWEMLPGDSLIDKIFGEGIKNSEAVIVVISKNSVNKPWVKEELNAGMIKRINSGSQLIPVIIDDCQVPGCLESTVWQKISDLTDYDKELERIVMSIFGQNNKPPVSRPPVYVKTDIKSFPDLTKIDSIVLRIACETAIKSKSETLVSTQDVLQEATKYEISSNALYDTLDVLDNKGFIKVTRISSGEIPIFNITLYGFDRYVKTCLPDFTVIFDKVCHCIVNKGWNNRTIAIEMDLPPVLVDHVFNLLEAKQLISFARELGGEFCIYKVSSELKRRLDCR